MFSKYEIDYSQIKTFRFVFITFIFSLIIGGGIVDAIESNEDHILWAIILLVFFVIYLLIIGNDLIRHKVLETSRYKEYELSSMSNLDLIEKIISTKDSAHEEAEILFRISQGAFKQYFSLTNENNKEKILELIDDFRGEKIITNDIKIKREIRKLEFMDVQDYMEKQYDEVALTFAYVISIYTPDYQDNVEIIIDLEKKLRLAGENNKIIKLRRAANYIYKEILKVHFQHVLRHHAQLGYGSQEVKMHQYFIILQVVSVNQLTKKETDFFSIIFHIIFPFGIITEYFKRKFNGY